MTGGEEGDLTSRFRIAVNGQTLNGNPSSYQPGWQPNPGVWYCKRICFLDCVRVSAVPLTQKPPPDISMAYAGNNYIRLFVNNEFVEDTTTSDGLMTQTGRDDASRQHCPCVLASPPVNLDAVRLGAWLDDGTRDDGSQLAGRGGVQRSMRGKMAVFRVWDRVWDESQGVDSCPRAGAEGLVVNCKHASLPATAAVV